MAEFNGQAFGLRVKSRRAELGIDQDELAMRVGWKSRQNVSHLERGKSDGLNIATLEKLADALGCSAAWLAWGAEQDYPTAGEE